MGQVLSPHTTIIKEVTKAAGEITINLVLTLKIEADGLKVSTDAAPAAPQPFWPPKPIATVKEDEDETDWMIPDIKNEGLIDFGKKAE